MKPRLPFNRTDGAKVGSESASLNEISLDLVNHQCTNVLFIRSVPLSPNLQTAVRWNFMINPKTLSHQVSWQFHAHEHSGHEEAEEHTHKADKK